MSVVDEGPSRAPTLRDVAARAGVAAITASRILNGSRGRGTVAPDTRHRVERAAADLGYRIDAAARAMRHRRFGQIGVVVANAPGNSLVNLAAYEYILGINAGLAAAGFVLSLVRLTDVEGAGDQPVRALDERMLDALVVLGHMPAPVTERLRGLGLPCVWLDTDVDAPTCCVRRDEIAAGRNAAGLLLARGRRNIVWLERPVAVSRNHYSRDLRERGARAACAEVGAAFMMLPIGSDFSVPDTASYRGILADARCGLLLADPPMTHRMVSWLAQQGLVPGRDLGVACCDADSQISALWPELSRIEVDRHALGVAAAELVAAAVGGGGSDSVCVHSPVVAGSTA